MNPHQIAMADIVFAIRKSLLTLSQHPMTEVTIDYRRKILLLCVSGNEDDINSSILSKKADLLGVDRRVLVRDFSASKLANKQDEDIAMHFTDREVQASIDVVKCIKKTHETFKGTKAQGAMEEARQTLLMSCVSGTEPAKGLVQTKAKILGVQTNGFRALIIRKKK